MTPALLDFVVNGRVAERNGNRHPRAAPHGVFACRSDTREEWVALSVMDDAEWQLFVCAIDWPGWATDPRLRTSTGRKANEDAIESHVAAWSAELARDEVVRRLRTNGLRVYPVNSMADLFEDPQLVARGFWRTVKHPVMGPLRVEAPPALLRSTPPVQERAAPLMGADTADVLSQIVGLTHTEIDDLRTDGALD
jgi:crotonobetainyl-CoA:carnitine CoA-transferase CaiB-like acyl-CoA transferase